MTTIEPQLINGLLMGLASSLHCGAMCGGVACGAIRLLSASGARDIARRIAIMQAGRILAYVTIGALAATVGATVIPDAASFKLMQWGGAAALMWIGLTLAGVMPRPLLLDTGMLRLRTRVDGVLRPLRTRSFAGPLSLGIMWGLNACPMIYGAAFFASLTGSVVHGAIFMAGFGLGTVPAVVAAAAGVSLMQNAVRSDVARKLGGGAVAIAGMASLYVTPSMVIAYCLTK